MTSLDGWPATMPDTSDRTECSFAIVMAVVTAVCAATGATPAQTTSTNYTPAEPKTGHCTNSTPPATTSPSTASADNPKPAATGNSSRQRDTTPKGPHQAVQLRSEVGGEFLTTRPAQNSTRRTPHLHPCILLETGHPPHEKRQPPSGDRAEAEGWVQPVLWRDFIV